MSHYFNEFDPAAAEWMRELMKAGMIPEGEVDERDIREVRADDLRGFHAVHLFAGIGGWPYALRLAGWPDERPVWTGSCPCQPYSAAGKGQGQDDERDLWPAMFRLIRECAPDVCFGEQVEGAVGHGWLDRVSADLEAEGYAVGSCVLGAHSVGSPNIRQRLYWVADSSSKRRQQDARGALGDEAANGRAGRVGCEQNGDHVAFGRGTDGRLAHSRQFASRQSRTGQGVGTNPESSQRRDEAGGKPRRRGRARRVADSDGRESGNGHLQRGGQHGQRTQDGGTGGGVADAEGERESEVGRVLGGQGAERGGGVGFWSRFDLIPCRDGKARRVEPGSFPLVDGLPGRVGLLRGYGNAICPQTAAAFVRAWQEVKAAT